jgi:hypothetical protein
MLADLMISQLLMKTALAGKPNCRGRLSTVDLLVITSSDQVLFRLKILISLFTKQATLLRWSTVLSLPVQLAFPGSNITRLP